MVPGSAPPVKGLIDPGRPGSEFNVRRLAAVDMWGASGSMLRRRLILIEFVLGVVGGLGIGIWLLVGSSGWFGVLLAIWVIGVGLNYLPLAVYAIRFSPAGALDQELDGVDVPAELRHYTTAQFRVFVPLWIAVSALRQT